MDLTHDDVRLILDLVDEHEDIEFLELRLGDLHLVADRTGTGGQSPPAAVPRTAGPGSAAAAEPEPPAGSATSPAVAAPEPDPPAGPATAPAGEVAVVTAPVVGVFFAAPEPGAPPYVEVGGRVEAEDTVGLIEVMKMFNGVQAGVRGEVVRILVANEEFVEFGQPLMEIRPEAGE
ncbi:acetyl-CoA carboxylase biotin carboxyl carrier protein subunit [Actinomadura sp. NBRC 104412]|uniref:acetyl-CoA carboxylase biotin carboxyl carrier protein n=1 Tax=Actinomadura sp. NBRC 104412 TaxID=3032203 RepID=UPI0024A582FA|nr:biotin/lipoyl-containing protein [Actinomadura sp. NBRC 104412]GLZ07787.1 acetyl-CoA carboxylase biotin carboxyl carrier protein subunit [Actinomadura sp. NBRC 104412]